MANFNTHLTVGMVASGLAATAALVAGVASEAAVLPLFVLGIVGSLLPDIDADNSAPVRIAFSLLSIIAAFLVMFSSAERFPSFGELLVIWLATYALCRFLIFALFARLTVHRGVFHTVPAILLSGMFTAALAYHGFDVEPADAWLAGGFVSFGYLIHLLLDELYSVNLFGTYTKRSFGTALKLGSRTSTVATVYIYSATALALLVVPSPRLSFEQLSERGGWSQLVDNAVPPAGWFAARRAPRAAASSAPKTAYE